MPRQIPIMARETAARLTPEETARLVDMVRAQAARLRTIRECPTPLDLAARHEPETTVRTPALVLVSRRLMETVRARDGRLVVSIPPQEGKTSTLRWLCAWLLADDPERRIVFASYASGLARTSGRIVRGLVDTHSTALGLSVAQDHADASDWQLAGHQGGMFTTGVGGSLTGRPADVLIIDDPIKNRQDADSELVRSGLHEWWQSVARTRLAPGAPVIVVQTRWHEDDLAGRRIGEGWPCVNIPAVADGETLDSLDRTPGQHLESARGRTAEDWAAIRRDVGERDWAALYQGRPAPREGGIFKQAWMDQHRVTTAPELARVEVAVDPADTGTGDAAGILVGGRSQDGHLYVLEDLSDALSRAAWARTACLAAVRWDAACLVSERTLGMQTAVGEAWSLLRRQATALRDAGGDPAAAAAALAAAGDQVAAHLPQLAEAQPWVDAILARPAGAPCRTVVITPKQSKQVRAEAVTVHYETGHAHHVGKLAELEHEMAVWQPGQPSPNRLDTLAHLLTHLQAAASVETTVHRTSRRIPTRTPNARTR
jgi:hypothetical protein